MKHLPLIALILCIGLLTGAASCKKTQKGPKAESASEGKDSLYPEEVAMPQSPERKLLEIYRNGEIERCTDASGKMVYRCQRNIRDIETRIYDASGAQIGTCFYSTGKVDAICRETTDCKTLYRVDKNIWGKPAVNLIEK